MEHQFVLKEDTFGHLEINTQLLLQKRHSEKKPPLIFEQTAP